MQSPDPNCPEGCGAQTNPAWQSTWDGAKGEMHARAFSLHVAGGTVVVGCATHDPPEAVDEPADMLVVRTEASRHRDRMSMFVHWLGFRMMSAQCVVELHARVLVDDP
jgi:hypothetical protein